MRSCYFRIWRQSLGFLEKHCKQFVYISSIHQEIMFHLLKYTELVKVGHIPEAQA